MELNREQIVKAWEDEVALGKDIGLKRDFINYVSISLVNNTLTLIRELTEENERLKNRITCRVVMPDEKMEEIKAECLERVEIDVKERRADTVRKMQTAIHEWYDRPCYKPTKKAPIKHTEVQFMLSVIDQIAKEIEEGD